MRTAIITMVHNEPVFLPMWIKHYNKLENVQLIVIDNGSDDGSTDDLPSFVETITFPHKEQIRDTFRIVSISDFQNALITYYDCVIYTDVDEFLVADPDSGIDLMTMIADFPASTISPIGLNVIQRQDCEATIDFTKPILEQRKHVVFSSEYSKPIITREKTRWMKGFHGCLQWPQVCPSIYLFHLRLVDFEFSLHRSELRMKRVIDGDILGTWGRTRDQMTSFFKEQSSIKIVEPEKNFDFEELIAAAMNSIVFSPDKTRKRLGHIESPTMHIVPNKFVESISGIG